MVVEVLDVPCISFSLHNARVPSSSPDLADLLCQLSGYLLAPMSLLQSCSALLVSKQLLRNQGV